ncbi:MAG: hypothetical protein J1F60_02255 [Oscillospiraceae bacterium]|nr:hypothetical protein [Oscillospiraceae bacterium]
MPRKDLNKEETLEALLERQERLTASYDEVKKELATRKKTLDTLQKKIEAEKEKQYLHNMKKLGQIVISHFGETFSQNDCKDMLEYIFAIREVQELIRTKKEKQAAVVEIENISDDSAAEKTQEENIGGMHIEEQTDII